MLLLVLCALSAAAYAKPSRVLDPYMEPTRTSTGKEFSPNNSRLLENESNQWCQQNNGNLPYDSWVQYSWYRVWKKMGPLDLHKIKLKQTGAMLMKVYMIDKILVMANFGLKADIIRICRTVEKAKNELKAMRDDREICMSSVNKDDIAETIQIISPAFDYACGNEGEKILDFVGNWGLACVIGYENELVSCLRVSVNSNLFNLPEPKDEEDLKKNRDQECPILNKLQDCVLDKISKCPNPVSKGFIEDVLSTVIMPSCNRLW